MGYKLKKSISLKEILIANQILFDDFNDFEITNVAALNQITEGSFSFAKSIQNIEVNCAILVSEKPKMPMQKKTCYIYTDNPRLNFIRVLDFLEKHIGFSHFDFESQIHPSVIMGSNVLIERGCKIAEDVILEHNVVIYSGTSIGKNSRIRANSSIGGDGFGFERMGEEGLPIRFPHLGGVEIGENVEIGSNTCVVRGVLSNTIIKNYVKVDNLVHIAHNCIIEEGAFVIACAELSGGVHIGRNAWVGPNACIIQKLSIGENALIGIGSVVTKSVADNAIHAGNPAKFIRNQDI
ncbi:UDP-3-O-(3-hydroxymyristoyl)glucosamine N-acyltransferase [Paralysiella testudinis]|uniref:UDP-3-O-(3-hydroxymyristoyl)glucosamine N-acyltransferase n=1 Tax=Paralysiella testudinis TaxID=2809020 RepID=A0A892ZH20_9NEIS|nr:UDP-3-O-(3-hydroxymyristoyl)glucosamine N-acyltransferase [Paralysiella testudinis]QRQ82441.1 UDP-3-O-(3-hydroxymyristoyl)glucosamine N-acyltransferase [Paralysiella testudinis]